jgi:hypothetical protein
MLVGYCRILVNLVCINGEIGLSLKKSTVQLHHNNMQRAIF